MASDEEEQAVPPADMESLSKSVPLPCDQPTWENVKKALRQLARVSTTSDLLPSLGNVYRAAHPHQVSWHTHEPLVETAHPFVGLGHFLEHVSSEEERDNFFRRVLPTIARLAGEIERWRPLGGVQYSMQQQESVMSLDRRFVASLIANAFLCTFPKQRNPRLLNSINFDEFFQFLICSSTKNSQAAKLRCFLYYFDRLADVDMENNIKGQISYMRQVLKGSEAFSLDGWLDSKAALCPLTVRHEGLIEDMGSHALQVDFANQFIGGGTVLAARQQEEIRFSTCPELLGSLLFTEMLQDNEAVIISGFEQFSQCSGYSSTLKFLGNFTDNSKRNSSGDLNNTLAAIDAIPWTGYLQNQYKPEHILRELNKAYVGFCYPKATETTIPIGQEEADSGSYHDALDQSLVSTDGTDFETASSGDDVSCKSASSATLQGYSSSLSRAITDIAIKDVTGSFPRLSLSRDESSHNSLSTVLTVSNASTPVNEMGPRELPGHQGGLPVLEDYASGLAEDALKESQAGGAGDSGSLEGRRWESDGAVSDGISQDAITGDSGANATLRDGNLEGQVKALVSGVISNAVEVIQSTNLHSFADETEVDYIRENRDNELVVTSQSVDGAAGIDTAEEMETSGSAEAAATPPFKNDGSQATPPLHSRESCSSKSSLADFSVISSSPRSSNDFIKLDGEMDVTYGQRHPNEAFSAEVFATDIMQDALVTLRKHFNLRSGICTTTSNDSLNSSEIHSETSMARDHSGSFDILTSGDFSSSPSLSEYVRVTAFSLDGLAEDIMSSAFEQLQEILREKAHPSREQPDEDSISSQRRNDKIHPTERRASAGNPPTKTEPRVYLPLTEEDLKNGNTLPSSGQDNADSHEGLQRASAADNFAERLVGQIFHESLQGIQTWSPLSSKSQHLEDPGTPPPSPTSPVELEAFMHTSQSFDKSLVTISEQPVIEEPQYSGGKRLSADSSGTESSQSREARIRECAEQLVARTLPESMKLLGGSAQTTSSSSSRRTSSPRSSIPNSSNRSSMDCFTEDLLKIGNIDPMGKRPSRTEESLAFFAQEIKRMAEAEEKSSKKQKEDFADFTMELQRGSTRIQPSESTMEQDSSLDTLAERYSVQVVSDVFVELFGEPWSEAENSINLDEDAKPHVPTLLQRPESPSGAECAAEEETVQVEEPPRRRPSEQDLLSMASNLANSIIEAALKIYREEHLHLPPSEKEEESSPAVEPTHASCPEQVSLSLPEEACSDVPRKESLSLEEFASAVAEDVITETFSDLSSILKEGGKLIPGLCEEVSPTSRRPISTGNWGCGAYGGDPQLKSLIQWMAASQVGSPRMIYHTFGDERVSRLQRVVNETVSRRWTVGDLLSAVLDHSWLTLSVDADPLTLFERIINSG